VVNQNAAFPLNVLPLGGVPKIVLICHQEKAPSLSAHSGLRCLAASTSCEVSRCMLRPCNIKYRKN